MFSTPPQQSRRSCTECCDPPQCGDAIPDTQEYAGLQGRFAAFSCSFYLVEQYEVMGKVNVKMLRRKVGA